MKTDFAHEPTGLYCFLSGDFRVILDIQMDQGCNDTHTRTSTHKHTHAHTHRQSQCLWLSVHVGIVRGKEPSLVFRMSCESPLTHTDLRV